MRSVLTINNVLLLAVVACLAMACGDDKKAAKVTGPHKIVPEEAIDITSMLSEPSQDSAKKLSAKVKGKLTAPYMLRFQRADSPYAEFPRTLHVDFFKDSVALNQRPTIESKLE